MAEQQPNEGSLFLTSRQAAEFAATLPAPPTITINGDDGAPLVKIHPDGTLEYGPHYDPDEAARHFWDAMRIHMPARCSNCGHIAGDGA